MKKLVIPFLIVSILATIISACSSELPIEGLSHREEAFSKGKGDFNISEREALSLADKITGNMSTRSGDTEVNITPIYAEGGGTRAGDSTVPLDTIAYIINYADNKGFSIISKDNRINPILAYSATGNFSLSNEIAKEQFVDRLNGYMKVKCVGNKKYDDSDVEDACKLVQNMITICLGQTSPFNRYVLMSHLNCPAGCVAVASALVMMHSKKHLIYNQFRYYFSDMRRYLAEGASSSISSYPGVEPNFEIIRDGLVSSYSQAVDYTAQLLYQIGKDVNMVYSPSGSGASSYTAYLLIKELGFDVVTGYDTVDLDSVAEHLEDNCIVYMRGSGHAWVVDGCRYCIDIKTRARRDIYVHCDWGWFGSCNGYYSGDVFATKAGSFVPSNYFAVKREVDK